jgi:hypothetical protein
VIKIRRCLGMFALVVVLAAGPDACRHVDMYSKPSAASASWAIEMVPR